MFADPVAAIAVLVVIAVVPPLVLALGGRQRNRRRYRALGNVARLLGAPAPARDATEVRGARGGQTITYRLITRRVNRGDSPWTEVVAPTATAPLRLALRPQTLGEELMRKGGLAVDIAVGERQFDEAFIVEAAPSDVARLLLGPELRRALLGLVPVALTLEDGELFIEKRGHVVDAAGAVALVKAAADLVGAVGPAVAAADLPGGDAGVPFRAAADPEEVETRRRARSREVAELAWATGRRARLRRRFKLTLAIVWLIITAVYGAAALRGIRDRWRDQRRRSDTSHATVHRAPLATETGHDTNGRLRTP